MANDESRGKHDVLKPVLKKFKSRKHKISDVIKLSKVSLSKTYKFEDVKQILCACDFETEIKNTREKMPFTPKKGGSNLDWGVILLDDGLPTNEMPPKQKDKQKTTQPVVEKQSIAFGKEKERATEESSVKRVVSNDKLPEPYKNVGNPRVMSHTELPKPYYENVGKTKVVSQTKLQEPHHINVGKPKVVSNTQLQEPHYENVDKPINKMPLKRTKMFQKGETIDRPIEATMPQNVIPKKNYFQSKRTASPPDELPPPCPELPKNVIPANNETSNNVCGSKAYSRRIQPFEKRKKLMDLDIPRPPSIQQIILDPQKMKETQKKLAESKKHISVNDNIKLKPGAYKIHDNRRRSTTPPITVHKYTPSRTYQKEHLIKEGEPTGKQGESASAKDNSGMIDNKDTTEQQRPNQQNSGLEQVNSGENITRTSADSKQPLTTNVNKEASKLPDIELQKKPVVPQQTTFQTNEINTGSKVPDPTQVQVPKAALAETKSKIKAIDKRIGKKTKRKTKDQETEDGKPKEMEFEYREEPRLYIKPPKNPLPTELTDNIRIMEKDVVPANIPKNHRMIQVPLKPGEVQETYLMKLKAKMQKDAEENNNKTNAGQKQTEEPKRSTSVRGCKLTTQEPPKIALTDEALAKKKEELKAEALREASLVASKALQEVKRIFQNAENKFIPIAKEAISVDKTLKEGVINLIDTMSEEAIGQSSDQNMVSDKKGSELLPNLKKTTTFSSMNNKNTSEHHSEKGMTNSDIKKPPIATSTWDKKQNVKDISEAANIYTIPRSMNTDHQTPTSIWGEISMEEKKVSEAENQHPKLAEKQMDIQVEVQKQGIYEFSDKNDLNSLGKNPECNTETHQNVQARISSEQEKEKGTGPAQNAEGKGHQGESNIRNNPNYLARRYATDLVRNPSPVMFRPPSSSASSSGIPPRGPPKQNPPARGPPTSGQGSDDGSGKDPPEIKVLLPSNNPNQSVQATIKVEFQIVQDENNAQLNQENQKTDQKAPVSTAGTKKRSPGAENPYVNLVSKDISSRKNRFEMINDMEQKNIHTQEAKAIPSQQINNPSQNQNQKFFTPNVKETAKFTLQKANEKQVNENIKANTSERSNSIADVNVYYYDAESMDAENRQEEAIRLAKKEKGRDYVHFIDEGRIAAAAMLAEEKKKVEVFKLADSQLKEEATKLAEKLKIEAVKLAEEKLKVEAMKLAEERRKIEELKLAEENRRAAAAKLAEDKRKAEELKLAEEKKKADALKLAEMQKADALKVAEEKKRVEALKLAEERKKAEALRLAEEKKKAEALKLVEERKKAEALRLAEEKKKAEALKLVEERKKAEALRLAEEKKRAEALKLAEERKKAEALRLAEEKKKAEALKLAEEKKKAEALRLAEEKKRVEALKLAEERKKAEALRLAEEKKKAEALKLAEEKKKAEALRLAAEKKRAEALKLAEEKKKAEEIRLAAEKRKAEAIKLAADRQKAEELKREAEKKKAEAIKLAAEKKKAEELRLAEEKKRVEAIRLAEERRKLDEVKAAEEKKRVEGIKLAEEKWKAEAFKLSEEKRKVEALRASEERWRTEALKLAEDKKRADAIRLAEEKRKAVEIKFEQEKLKVESLRLSEEKWKAEAIKLAAEKQMAIASKIAEERRQAEAARLSKDEDKARALKLAEDKRKADAFKKAEEMRKGEAQQNIEAQQKSEAFNKAEQRKIEEGVRIAEEKRVAQEFKLAEEKRKAEEQVQAEQKKKIEAIRLAEEKRKSEEIKIAEERKKAEAIRQARAEEIRLADEKKRNEAMRLLEEKRRVEEIKLAVEKKAAEAAKNAEERKKAETRRLAEVKRRADEIKLAEGGKKAAMVKLTEEKRKEEDIKIAEEKKKAEAIKLAEEKWKADVVKQAEEKRLAEEIRLVEEKRRADAEKLAEERQKEEAIKIAAEKKRMEAIKLAEAKKMEAIRKFNEGKQKVETIVEKAKVQKLDHVKEDEREVITKLAKETKVAPVSSSNREEGRTNTQAKVKNESNPVAQHSPNEKNELQQPVIKVGESQRAGEKESSDSDKKRRSEALKLTEVKRNAEAIKLAEQRSKTEALKAAAESRLNEDKRKLEEKKAADLKKKQEYLALIEKKRKAQAAILAEEKKKEEASRSANEKKISNKTSPITTIWPAYEDSKNSQEKLNTITKKTNSATLKAITPNIAEESALPKKTSQAAFNQSNASHTKAGPVTPSADAVPFEKGFGTFYDWTTPSSLARKAALHMDMPIHRQGQRRLDGMKREIGITSANKMYQLSAPCQTNLPKPPTPCPICPDAPAPPPGASSPPSNAPPPPGDLPPRPSSSVSHDSEPPRSGPAPLSGISKYFNSTTISGRANVAKATFAVMGLYALNRMIRKPSKESKPHAKR